MRDRLRFNGWAAARLVAFLLVASMSMVAVALVQNESRDRDRAILAERNRVGDAILVSLGQGSVNGCVADNKLIYNSRAQLKDQIANARPVYAQLVHDGTLTQHQVERLIVNAHGQVERYLRRLKFRNCEEAANRFLKQIKDESLRKSEKRNAVLMSRKSADQLVKQRETDAKRRARLVG